MKKMVSFLAYIVTAIIPIIIFYLFELYTHNPWETMKVPIQLLNIVLFELIFLFLLFLTGKKEIALTIQSMFFMIVGLANYYVIDFRSAPIMPWDIYSVKTAASVANNYQYTIKRETVFIILGFLLLTGFVWGMKFLLKRSGITSPKKINLWIRAGGLLISALLLFGFTKYVQREETVKTFKMYDKLFTPTVMSKRDGTAVAFLMELQYLSIEKPVGYSKEKALDILNSYNQENTVSGQKLPNIIVIMNEAFSDPDILGEFQTNEDYIPFVHSLLHNKTDHTLSGYVNVSVLGGNTANTEFEFLTGNTMAFLPQGSVAYQQYVKKELPSIASDLKSLGYETIAMHPYNRGGWDRDKVYPLLGFDTFYSLTDWKKPHKIRKYVSDQSCYEKIIELYENKEEDVPLFIFNVTMQNHSSYSEEFDNFEPDITVKNTKSKILPNYLSLLKLSDQAIQNLVEYFSTASEPTIIVFFGDHQTTNSVMSPIYKMNGKSIDELSPDEENERYRVPFFLYCNYDIDGQIGIETSTNYLKNYIYELADIPDHAYGAFLQDLQKSYPVLTSIRIEDASGNSTPVKEKQTEINDYAILQYYYLFGQK